MKKITFSFGGGAWLFPFYYGVAHYIATHLKNRNDPNIRFCGLSVCTPLVTALASGTMDLRDMYKKCLRAYPRCKNNPFAMTKAGFQVAYENVPDDDWFKNVSRLLFGVSEVTRSGLKAKNISSFKDRKHALQIMYASAHIPVIGGILPTCIDGSWYYDGTLTQNHTCLPVFGDEDTVVYITACNKPHQKGYITPGTSFPFLWQIFPPSVEVLDGMFNIGYQRAEEFFSDWTEYFT